MVDLENFKQTVLLAAQTERKKVTEKRPTVTMKMEIWTRKGCKNPNTRYVFKIMGKEFESDDDSLREVKKVSKALTECCTILNAKRGYLVREVREEFYYQGRDVFGYITLSEWITSGLVFLMKPCKEYAALQRYIEKHANMRLLDLDLYRVSVCGKRGSNYTESSERHYYAHDAVLCKNILAWIGKYRKQGNEIIVGIDEKRDCEDEAYSREYETESYGTYHRYLRICIKVAIGPHWKRGI